MDKLWWFSDTNTFFRAPGNESIVDDQGAPIESAVAFQVELSSAEDVVAQLASVNQIIFISGRKLFKSDYLALIPPALPSLALIKASTSADARAQLEQLDLDGLIPSANIGHLRN